MKPNFKVIAQELANRSVPPVDLHMHTAWTDGQNSIGEMLDAAAKSGLATVLFSEHARVASKDWFADFAIEVRKSRGTEVEALVGAEVKITHYDGSLDICPEIRRECDLVMGVVHRFPEEFEVRAGQPPPYSPAEAVAKEFELSRTALRRGGFDILGHPFGMCYRRFRTAPPQELMDELIDECARAGIAFEINAHYHPDMWDLVDRCVERQAGISLGSNAHACGEVGNVVRAMRTSA